MILNCGVGEDSWESLGLQGDPTSQSQRKQVLNIHWKDWYWSWNSNSLSTWCEELTHWKRPDAGKDWRWEKKGTTEDEMTGSYHRLYWREFEQALRVDEREAWHTEVLGVAKNWTLLSDWTDILKLLLKYCFILICSGDSLPACIIYKFVTKLMTLFQFFSPQSDLPLQYIYNYPCLFELMSIQDVIYNTKVREQFWILPSVF